MAASPAPQTERARPRPARGSRTALTTMERAVYDTLARAGGAYVRCGDLIDAVYGGPSPEDRDSRTKTMKSFVAEIRRKLRETGSTVRVLSTGTAASLSYALHAPHGAELSGVEPGGQRWTPEQDAEILRLEAQGLNAAAIAARLGKPSGKAVLSRLERVLAAQPAPAQPEPSEAAPVLYARRSNPPDGITLPPCGYAAWSYRPAATSEGTVRGGVIVIRRVGEDCTRVLTVAERKEGYTTEDARIEVAAQGEDDPS